MTLMSAFVRALSWGVVLAVISALLLTVLDAPEGAFLAAAVLVGFATSLFDKEGFYGDPHPFRRRTR